MKLKSSDGSIWIEESKGSRASLTECHEFLYRPLRPCRNLSRIEVEAQSWNYLLGEYNRLDCDKTLELCTAWDAPCVSAFIPALIETSGSVLIGKRF